MHYVCFFHANVYKADKIALQTSRYLGMLISCLQYRTYICHVTWYYWTFSSFLQYYNVFHQIFLHHRNKETWPATYLGWARFTRTFYCLRRAAKIVLHLSHWFRFSWLQQNSNYFLINSADHICDIIWYYQGYFRMLFEFPILSQNAESATKIDPVIVPRISEEKK